MPNRPAHALSLDEGSRAALTAWTRSRTLPQRQVLRAQIALHAADGIANSAIAEQVHCSIPTVLLWRQRFQDAGVAGLEEDAPGRGRPRTHDEQVVAQIISVTLGRPPKGDSRAPRWHSSCCRVAEPMRNTTRSVYHHHQSIPLSSGDDDRGIHTAAR